MRQPKQLRDDPLLGLIGFEQVASTVFAQVPQLLDPGPQPGGFSNLTRRSLASLGRDVFIGGSTLKQCVTATY